LHDHAYRRSLGFASDFLRKQWLGNVNTVVEGAEAALIPTPNRSACRAEVDGNDALDVYHSALGAQPRSVGSRCSGLPYFSHGLYSSHFGEVPDRSGLAAAEDAIRSSMADWLVDHQLASERT
jgi:hypothetical protein